MHIDVVGAWYDFYVLRARQTNVRSRFASTRAADDGTWFSREPRLYSVRSLVGGGGVKNVPDATLLTTTSFDHHHLHDGVLHIIDTIIGTCCPYCFNQQLQQQHWNRSSR